MNRAWWLTAVQYGFWLGLIIGVPLAVLAGRFG